ncbi:MAG: LysR family transcriptional regulator [Kofleriaceae bacterium]
MKIERVRRLRALWDYLPAFRAVAEAEHLPTAAAALAVTPPALSRAIRLLEADLGEPLFERRGRQLVLNPRGQALLAALRVAMRTLDEALLAGAAGGGAPLRVALTADTAWLFPGWVAALGPDGVRLQAAPYPSDPVAALSRGDLDLVVHGSHRVVAGVQLDRVGDVRWRPVRGKVGVRSEGRGGGAWPMVTAPGDPWPAASRREVTAEVDSILTAASVAARGHHAALVPAPLAAELGLRPAPGPTLTTPVFVSSRPPVGEHADLARVLEALRRIVGAPRRAARA